MTDSKNPESISQSDTHGDENNNDDCSHVDDFLNASCLLNDAQSLSYDELLQRFEKLFQYTEKLPSCDRRQVAEELLAGAEELILRQDEMGKDFAVAIVALNEQANRHILAVVRKNESGTAVGN